MSATMRRFKLLAAGQLTSIRLEKLMEKESITFSFGENWENFVETVSDAEIEKAKSDIQKWLGESSVTGTSVLDIGSGSGIHSYCYYLLGAKSIFSFDYDRNSVAATRTF